MSKLPLIPIFSAAHVSKWEVLPEDTFRRATQPRLKLERATWLSDSDQHNHYDVPLESSKSDDIVHSMHGCRDWSIESPTNPPARRVATESREHMAVKTYTWITLWFLLTTPVILWDATYCFMRPRSMVGGDLHWIWEPYGLYQEIDYVYGMKAIEENSGFPSAQSFLNLVETALNLTYVYLAHVSGWSGAPLIGFAGVTMTLSKTVLYGAQEYYCGGCAVGHNAWGTLLLYWVLPNGFWLVFPSLIVWRLGSDIIDSLSASQSASNWAASRKTQ